MSAARPNPPLSSHLTLIACVDGTERARLVAPPSMGARAWMLAVTAVQVSVAHGRVVALLRVHRTGLPEPTLIELPRAAIVHIALAADADEPLPRLPPSSPLGLDGAAARLCVAIDGVRAAESALAPDRLGDEPPPRAFGHVFCRWLRDGGDESGYDLTAFQSSPPGVKFERLVNEPLAPSTIVGYSFIAQ